MKSWRCCLVILVDERTNVKMPIHVAYGKTRRTCVYLTGFYGYLSTHRALRIVIHHNNKRYR